MLEPRCSLGGVIGQRNPAEYKATTSERLSFAMRSLVGLPVTITLKGGGLFDGILSTGWWDEAGCPEDAKGKQAGVVMRVVRQVVGPEELVAEAVARRVFRRTDIVSLVIKDADLYNDERTVVARSIGDGVLADTEIEVAGRGAGEDRELVRATTWLSEDTALDADLSMSKGGSTRNWDQFAVNERLGHRSNYSDDLYTTKLTMDKYTPEQLAKAQAMAAEIEKKGSTNKHVLEERGLKELDDNDDEDEEAKYSMVLTSDGTDPTRAVVSTITAPATPALPAAPPASGGSPSVDAPAAGGEAPSKPPLSMKSKLNAAAKAFVPGKPYGGAGAGTPAMSGAMSGADAALSPRLPPQPQMVQYSVASPPQAMMYTMQ
ncbi:mRNA polyadenylation regulating, partial [Chrysochromulina tobinii]